MGGGLVAVGLGALWGAMGYSVLWDGTPFVVDRAFVESALGTLALLPARLVLWAIRGFELALDRTFNFADNHVWIGFVSAAVGALLALVLFLAVRAAVRRLRRA